MESHSQPFWLNIRPSPSPITFPNQPLNMVNISTMHKEEATAYLLSLGEVANTAWSVIEIRSRIKELRARDQKKGLGVNSGSTKEQLQQACRLKGLSFTSNHTKGDLLRKLRTAQEYEVEGSAETLVGFGKWASLTYKEVPHSYMTWVIKTYQEGGTECGSGLIRLARWGMAQRGARVESQEETPVLETPFSEISTAETPVPQPTPSSVASSAAGQVRARKATKRAGASPSKETAQEPEATSPELEKKMETMMGHLMAGMQAMQNRLISLETNQHPPKNTEESQSQETTPSQDSFKLVYSNQGSAWPMEHVKPGPVEVRDHA